MEPLLLRMARWQRTFQHIMAFKIGIATCPEERWELYGREEMWLAMDVVYRGDAQTCRMLETRLIEILKRIPGCYNQKPGGEGISSTTDHKCTVYFVFAPCGGGVGSIVAHRRRLRALGKCGFSSCCKGPSSTPPVASKPLGLALSTCRLNPERNAIIMCV